VTHVQNNTGILRGGTTDPEKKGNIKREDEIAGNVVSDLQ
jgi:hypothetical protein